MIRGIYSSSAGLMLERDRLDVAANNLANASTTGFKKDLVIVESPPAKRLFRVRDTVGPSRFNVGQSQTGTERQGIYGSVSGRFGSVLAEAIVSDIRGQDFRRAPWPASAAAVPVGEIQMGSTVGQVGVDHAQGPLIETHEPLDVALSGPGFLEVLTPAGPRYTRQGSFALLDDGALGTRDGYVVMGEDGPLRIPGGPQGFWESASDTGAGGGVSIQKDGTVTFGGAYYGRLRVAHFDDPSLMIKEGESLYRPGRAVEIPFANLSADGSLRTEVLSGFIEGSNVNPIEEMVEIITIMRAYEMGQKAIQAHDETLGRAVNDIAKV